MRHRPLDERDEINAITVGLASVCKNGLAAGLNQLLRLPNRKSGVFLDRFRQPINLRGQVLGIKPDSGS